MDVSSQRRPGGRRHCAARVLGSRQRPRRLVPVMDQVDAGDDVDDRSLRHGQHAGVAGQEQAIRLVEVDPDLELGQRPGHDLVDGHLARVAAVVQDPGERHFLDAADRLAVAQHRELRDPGRLEQLDGRRDGVLGPDRHQRARAACPQQVADRGGGWRVPVEVVFGQPAVVEELAQVIPPGVGAEGDDQVVGPEAVGVAQRGGDGRAAGAAHQDPLAPRQGSRRVERLGVADPDPLVDHLAVERLGHEVLADPLHLPGRGASPERTEPSGSAPITRIAGFCSLR